jgi:hypothetical protein
VMHVATLVMTLTRVIIESGASSVNMLRRAMTFAVL